MSATQGPCSCLFTLLKVQEEVQPSSSLFQAAQGSEKEKTTAPTGVTNLVLQDLWSASPAAAPSLYEIGKTLIYRAGLQPVWPSSSHFLQKGRRARHEDHPWSILYAKVWQCVGRKRTWQSMAEETMPGKPGWSAQEFSTVCMARLDRCWGWAEEFHTADGQGAAICRLSNNQVVVSVTIWATGSRGVGTLAPFL